LCDETGKILVDDLIRFENIENDFAKINSKLTTPVSLPHRNSSNRSRDVDSLYDKEMREIVYKKFKIDFDTFNYIA